MDAEARLRLSYQRGYRRPPTIIRIWIRAVSSAGEHYVDIVGVTGSIPVPPTIFSLGTPPYFSTASPAAGNCDDRAVRYNHSGRLIFEETQHGPIHRRLPVRQRPICGVGTPIPGRPLS